VGIGAICGAGWATYYSGWLVVAIKMHIVIGFLLKKKKKVYKERALA